MPQIINTNIASLNAQRNLNGSQTNLNSALQRLSSGLRINSAKDDAAGLAISERMTSQVRGLNQAVRNSNDAISLSQTAEGNLAEIGNLLQRMREISVQSANDTNTTTDRSSLQTEVTQLTEELDRIANSAQFNGKALLDGSFTSSNFQVGANAGQTISFSISSAKTVDLGVGGIATATGVQATPQAAYAYTGAMTLAVTGGTIATISAQTDDGVSYVAGGRSGATSALSMAQAINRQTGTTSIVARAQTVRQSATMSTYAALVSGDLKINGIDIGAVSAGTSTATQAGNVVAAINAKSTLTGVTAVASATGYTLETADGRNIDITHTTALDKSAYTGQNVTSAAPAQTYYGSVTLTSGKAITIGGTVTGSGLTMGTYALLGTTVDVTSQAAATSAITSIDSALAAVNTQRATLGAVQNRFDSVIANLQSSSENLSAARSRIRDADFAAETAALTRGQIMQQAGVAMLAQANSLPNNVLSLLK